MLIPSCLLKLPSFLRTFTLALFLFLSLLLPKTLSEEALAAWRAREASLLAAAADAAAAHSAFQTASAADLAALRAASEANLRAARTEASALSAEVDRTRTELAQLQVRRLTVPLCCGKNRDTRTSFPVGSRQRNKMSAEAIESLTIPLLRTLSSRAHPHIHTNAQTAAAQLRTALAAAQSDLADARDARESLELKLARIFDSAASRGGGGSGGQYAIAPASSSLSSSSASTTLPSFASSSSSSPSSSPQPPSDELVERLRTERESLRALMSEARADVEALAADLNAATAAIAEHEQQV
jgi:hypothetical protein